MEQIKAATKQSFEEKNVVTVEVLNQKIVIFKISDQYYAVSDTCTHRGGPLSEGTLENAIVAFPWHGARFDLSTGQSDAPAGKNGHCMLQRSHRG